MHNLLPVWQVIVICTTITLLTAMVFLVLFYRRIIKLKENNARLQATLDVEREGHAEKIETLMQARTQLSDTFTSLASQALQTNNATFLDLAKENLKQFHIKAQGELVQREKSIENIVQPIKETLEKAEKEIRRMENERKQAYGSLQNQLQSMTETQQHLQKETRNLAQALRRPEVRGRWGEMTLKRLVELAGMVEHCDFMQQVHQADDDGNAIRPDMVVHLPAGRDIVVDVKTPLDSYLSALEADNDQSRNLLMQKHCRGLRTRVKELATKAYWKQFKQSPDFVILFIPGEQFLTAALDLDPDLLEYSLKQKIILATPSSFIAVLRAVAFGWRQQKLTENAELIRQIGEQLYHRLSTFSEHLAKTGKALNQAASAHNKSIGAFERLVLPGAKKFTELGVSDNHSIDAGEPVSTDPRLEKHDLET